MKIVSSSKERNADTLRCCYGEPDDSNEHSQQNCLSYTSRFWFSFFRKSSTSFSRWNYAYLARHLGSVLEEEMGKLARYTQRASTSLVLGPTSHLDVFYPTSIAISRDTMKIETNTWYFNVTDTCRKQIKLTGPLFDQVAQLVMTMVMKD